MSAPQTTPRTANMCGNIPTYFAIEQITWNQLHWLKLLHASYIFLWRQTGRGRVFHSADKCYEPGADPRNIFHKQLLKVWKPYLSVFYCAIPRGVWNLAPSRDFRNKRARGQKTIGSHLNVCFDTDNLNGQLYYFLSTPCFLFNTIVFCLCAEYSRVAPSQLLRKRIASTHSHVVQKWRQSARHKQCHRWRIYQRACDWWISARGSGYLQMCC